MWLFFLSLFTFPTKYSVAKTVAEICPQSHGMVYGKTVNDVRKNLCNLQERISDDKVLQLARNIEDILSTMKSDQAITGNEAEYSKLDRQLKLLEDRLNVNRPSYNPKQNSKLSQNLKAYLSQIKGHVILNNERAFTGFVERVLQSTPTGRKLLACYKSDVGPRKYFIESKVEFDIKLGETGDAGRFDIDPSPYSSNGMRPLKGFKKKVLILNPKIDDPIEALLSFAHEMQHGCQGEIKNKRDGEFFGISGAVENGCEKSSDKGSKCFEELNAHQVKVAEYFQEHIVDEIRSYKLSLDLFKELVTTDPNFFCTSQYFYNYPNSFFTGIGVFNLGDTYQILEKRFQDKDIGEYVADHYSKEVYPQIDGNLSSKKYLFQVDSSGKVVNDEKGRPLLRKDFRDRLLKENWAK